MQSSIIGSTVWLSDPYSGSQRYMNHPLLDLTRNKLTVSGRIINVCSRLLRMLYGFLKRTVR